MMVTFVILWIFSILAVYVLGLHDGYRKATPFIHRSLNRERQLQRERDAAMSAYEKVVRLYNQRRDDDSTSADWWKEG